MKTKAAETAEVGSAEDLVIEKKLDTEIQEMAKDYTGLDLEKKIELLGLITKDIKSERDALQSRLNTLNKLFSTEVVSTPRRQTAPASTAGKQKRGKRAETAAAEAEKIYEYLKKHGPTPKGKVMDHCDLWPAPFEKRLKLLKGRIEEKREGTSKILSAR